MPQHSFSSEPWVAVSSVVRGIVAATDDDQLVVVRVQDGEQAWLIEAELVVASASPLLLQPGDPVLCWIENDDRDRGVILGRIGAPVAIVAAEAAPVNDPAPEHEEAPDTLVLEAKQSLTLRVGEGSITIRQDGKILIKGRDLVSHAQRLNRIKGGAVQIN